MSAYELHPEAFADIDEIATFIGSDNPDAAHRMVNEIHLAIQSIVPFPNRGFRRTDLTSRLMRFVRVRDYLIAYAPDKKPLWVVAVLHGHRSPRVMASILRDREQ